MCKTGPLAYLVQRLKVKATQMAMQAGCVQVVQHSAVELLPVEVECMLVEEVAGCTRVMRISN